MDSGGIKLPSGESTMVVDSSGYKYLRVLQIDKSVNDRTKS